MERKSKRNIRSEDVAFVNKTAEALGQPDKAPDKPFNGALINGVWMAPHPDLTPSQQTDLRKKITSIKQHRN